MARSGATAERAPARLVGRCRGAVQGILDTGPESLVPSWPTVLREFPEPAGVKWSYFARNVERSLNAYQEAANRGGTERPNDVVFSKDGKTIYVVDHGEVHTDVTMPSPSCTVPESGVIWTITYTGETTDADLSACEANQGWRAPRAQVSLLRARGTTTSRLFLARSARLPRPRPGVRPPSMGNTRQRYA
jgi:hypothetical protein